MKPAWIVLPLVLFALGCASEPRHARHAATGSPTRVVYEIPRPSNTEVATGEEQRLMQHLDRVYFALDSSIVPADAHDALRAAAAELEAHPDLRLYVLGFADEQGSENYNWQLALERAHAVCAILRQEGVPDDQIAVISFGEQRPLVDANSQAAYAMNRRVEFRVMRGDTRLTLSPTDDRSAM